MEFKSRVYKDAYFVVLNVQVTLLDHLRLLSASVSSLNHDFAPLVNVGVC